MLFVVVLSSAEFFAPVIILVLIGLGYGLETGAVQNALVEWFSYWVFTPSFFSVALFLTLLLVLFNGMIAYAIAEKFHFERLHSIAFDMTNSTFMELAPIFAFMFVVGFSTFCLLDAGCCWGHDWLYTNHDYSWCDWLHD